MFKIINKARASVKESVKLVHKKIKLIHNFIFLSRLIIKNILYIFYY